MEGTIGSSAPAAHEFEPRDFDALRIQRNNECRLGEAHLLQYLQHPIQKRRQPVLLYLWCVIQTFGMGQY
jgi:hypothetical protein